MEFGPNLGYCTFSPAKSIRRFQKEDNAEVRSNQPLVGSKKLLAIPYAGKPRLFLFDPLLITVFFRISHKTKQVFSDESKEIDKDLKKKLFCTRGGSPFLNLGSLR